VDTTFGSTVVLAEDRELVSAEAAVAQVRPAGLLYGLSAVGAGSPASLEDDIVALWEAVSDAEPIAPYFVLSQRGALYLASLRHDGVPRFPNVTVTGGSITGVPVVISRAAANLLMLIDAGKIAVADSGLDVAPSTETAVLMDDQPSTPSNLVSIWQTDSIALRFTRWLNWGLAGDDAVAYLELTDLAGSPSGSPAW
jgi:hypothetical protein